jgi:hypothetical protein
VKTYDPVLGGQAVVIPGPIRRSKQGKKLEQYVQTVPCLERYDEEDVTGEGGDLVQGVVYHVHVVRTWYMTVSRDGQGFVQASSTDRQHKHKDGGKHHSKGKHGK